MPRPKSPVRLDWVDPAVCSLDYRLKIIGRLPFFKHLPAPAITEINRWFHDFDAASGQTIYLEGDEAEYLYLVAMGKVKLVRSAAGGREVLLDILARRRALREPGPVRPAHLCRDRRRPDRLLHPAHLRRGFRNPADALPGRDPPRA